jgi:hypothetical protein
MSWAIGFSLFVVDDVDGAAVYSQAIDMAGDGMGHIERIWVVVLKGSVLRSSAPSRLGLGADDIGSSTDTVESPSRQPAGRAYVLISRRTPGETGLSGRRGQRAILATLW